MLVLCLLTSCQGINQVEIKPNFIVNSVVSVEYLQTEYLFAAETASDGSLIMKIKKPENLNGITLKCNAEKFTAECGSLAVECDNGYIPLTQFYKVLSFLKTAEPISIVEGKSTVTLEYIFENDKYSVECSTDGKILKINTPTGEYELR